MARTAGPIALMARSKTFSTFRTKSLQALPARLSRHCRSRNRARRPPPASDLTAYDLYLRACTMELSEAPEALHLLDRAIGRDPHNGPALSLAAHFHAQRCIAGWSEDPEADCRVGADFARRALQVARDDPGTIVDAPWP